ncbi:MAG TPA: ABC transporter substrate-binding protein [Chloroflexota bacterium]|nr:ABC transporter substrate-binding protein [Chloroflexota bacterium]
MAQYPSWRLRAAHLVLLALLAACAPAAPAARPTGSSAPPAAASAPTAAPAATQFSPALQAIVDGARQEGQLTLIWGEGTMGGTEGARRIAEGLNRTYGLNLNVQFTPGPSMANMMTKLTEETQAGRRASTDVMVGYGVHMAALVQAQGLLPVDWQSWAVNIRNPELIAANGAAVTFQTSYSGITYNTQRLTGDNVPRSMQDLLKPQYKGRLASTPYGATFDYLATDEVWGEQRTDDYLRRLSDQLAGLIRCNETERIASGEFDALALDCSQSNALEAKAKGMPVDIVIPSDAVFLIPLYMAVPKTAAHPNAAKLWIDYALSREVQDLLAETDAADSHLVEGSKTAKQLEQLRAQGVRFTVADIDFVLRQDEGEYNRRRAKVQQILLKQ